MNYEIQDSFLRRQRFWLMPSAAACALFLAEAIREPQHFGEKILGAALAFGLLWASHDFPNYLGLDADPWRRVFWLSRSRWGLFLIFALAGVLAGAWLAIAVVALAVVLHLLLRAVLLKLERRDQRAGIPARLTALAFAFAAVDILLLWLAHRGGVSPVLLSELLLCFAFLFGVLLRLRSVFYALFIGFGASALTYFLTAASASRVSRDILTVAVFLWTAGTIFLLARANLHNLANYDDLLENLQAFLGESREAIVPILLESVPLLARNWRHVQPQGQEAVAAWYSANARLYLLANCQHHLLYRHIKYTLGLLSFARGRVLDFGGGNGDFSRALARNGVDTTYLDVPGDAARYLQWRAQRERLPLKVVLDRNQLQGPFDVIFCLDVIEHLVDLPSIFEQFRQLLRPGGKLLATYYNGLTSSAPMHIDPGYDALEFLLAHGFRNVKSTVVGFFSPELMHKNHFMILERETS
jgi:2-polyprenyl-3-methyl-5-hydroxy-6-metoxy-1,4-benzoquinol methylase